MILKKINIGDRAEEVSEKIDYNFNEVLSAIQQVNMRIDSITTVTKRFSQRFSTGDFAEGKMEFLLLPGWSADANISVYEKNEDATYSKVDADIRLIDDTRFEVYADIPFEGKVVVSYD